MNITRRFMLVTGILFIAVAVSEFSVGAASFAGDGDPAKLPPQVEIVKGTRIRLACPEGWIRPRSFTGFQHLESKSSIVISELPESFSKLAKAFRDPIQLAKQGVVLVGVEELGKKSDDMLLEATQSFAGIQFEKWIRVFGDHSATIMVVATYPATQKNEFRIKLRKAVLAAELVADAKLNPLAALAFTIDVKPLQFHIVMQNMVLFTIDGKNNKNRIGAATFSMAPSIAPVRPANRKQFAIDRLKSLGKVTQFKLLSIKDVVIDSLPGYEISARIVRQEDESETALLATMLFEGVSYWLAIGKVRVSESDQFLPVFARASKSFKRKTVSFKSLQSNARLNLPATWSEITNSKEDLCVANPTAGLVIKVMSEPRMGNSFNDFQKAGGLSSIQELAGEETVSGPRIIQVGGRFALQYKWTESSKGLRFFNTYSLVDGPKTFHHLLIRIPAEADAADSGLLDRMLSAFQDLDDSK